MTHCGIAPEHFLLLLIYTIWERTACHKRSKPVLPHALPGKGIGSVDPSRSPSYLRRDGE